MVFYAFSLFWIFGIFVLFLLYRWGYMNSLYMFHKKAYQKYKKEVETGKKSYQRFVTDFCNENVFISYEKGIPEDQLNKRNKNYKIVQELLFERSDLVVKYFGQGYFLLEDFKKSHKEFNTTTFPVITEETEGKKQLKPIIKKTFESFLDDEDINVLVKCVNEIRLFNIPVTHELLKKLFACELDTPLQTTNNKLLAYFFSMLNYGNLITPNWQAVCGANKLFLSLNGKILTQASLSSANAQANEILPKGSETIDRYLKHLKRH